MTTSEHPSLHTPLHTHIHTQRLGFFKQRVFPFYSETHTPVAKCPFDVRSASWENIASCMCHHQAWQQERSPEDEAMEEEEEVEVLGSQGCFSLMWEAQVIRCYS